MAVLLGRGVLIVAILVCYRETSVGASKVQSTPFLVDTTAQTNKYIVSNGTGTVCIVMVADITFHIKYNATGDPPTKTTNVTIPDQYTTSGDCNIKTDEQIISIQFFNNTWSLSIKIDRDSQTKLSTVSEDIVIPYSWRELTLKYLVDENVFPDIVPASIGQKVENTVWYMSGKFHTSGQSFYCNDTRTLNLSKAIEMDVSELQYRAFGITDDDSFLNTSITECSNAPPPKPTKGVDETAAIVLGAVCGGLLVIILVVYILCRHHQQSSYMMFS